MKKIIFLALAALAGLSYKGYKKVSGISNAAKFVTAKIGKISKVKFNIVTGKVSFSLDLNLFNPTNTPIDIVTGSLITLNKILVYNVANVLIASAITHITSIAIPANGSVTIPNIPFDTTAAKVGNELQNILVPNYLNTFKVKVELTALGNTYTINSPIGLNNNLI